MEDTAIFDVSNGCRRPNLCRDREFDGRTIGTFCDGGEIVVHVEAVVKSLDRDPFRAVEFERFQESPRRTGAARHPFRRGCRGRCARSSAIVARTPSRSVPFAAQSRLDPVPSSSPANTTSGVSFSRYRRLASKTVVWSSVGDGSCSRLRRRRASRSRCGRSRTSHASSPRGSAPGAVGVELVGSTPCSASHHRRVAHG